MPEHDAPEAPVPSLGEGVPARLEHRVSELLKAHGVSAITPADASRVARVVLDELAAEASPGRASALDLLAVDALVTRAIELSAADPASLETHTARMIRALSGADPE